jgi:hypothetical protein
VEIGTEAAQFPEKKYINGIFVAVHFLRINHTDKKENRIFLIDMEILSGAVAKSYMNNGLLIYGEIFANFLIVLGNPSS